MKLTDLNPQWIGSGGEGIFDKDMNPVPARQGVGLMCDCPCGCGNELYVPFTNPRDGGDNRGERVTWQRTGDEFKVLTLTPSIRRIPVQGSCGWHGFITNGEIITCSDSTPPTRVSND